MNRKLTRRSFSAVAVGVPGVVLLSACTGRGFAPPSPTANKAITEPQTGGGVAQATTAPNAPSLGINLVDIAFQPNTLTIPPDTDVVVKCTNKGQLQHDWVVENQNVGSSLLDGGSEEDVLVNLPAGSYPFECTVPGHAEAGMVGTLVVDPSAKLPSSTAGGSGGSGTPAEGTPAGEATPAAGGTPAPAGAGASAPVTVKCVELAFDPKDVTIPANTDATVHVQNAGALQHDWVVTDAPGGKQVGSKLLNSGEGEDVTVNLPAGTYHVECTVPGHAAAGMVGTLTVQ